MIDVRPTVIARTTRVRVDPKSIQARNVLPPPSSDEFGSVKIGTFSEAPVENPFAEKSDV